jgi:WD40 repeat protein
MVGGALPAAGGSGGAVIGGGGAAFSPPTCSYSLPRAGEAGHGGGVTAIAIAADKNWIVSGGEDGSVLCWDLAAGVTPGPTCAAAVTALLYADGWLLCATQAGGITGHNTA